LTHAFFKALLFLGSGAVIHALAGEQDLRRMGGLRRPLPTTYWTFVIGALAIAGVPGLAGFFSKDEILFRTFASGHTVLWTVGVLTSLMTAFYMFRLVFMAFHGEPRFDHHGHHPHDAPAPMALPLVLLAAGSVVAGYLGVPAALGGSNVLEHFLEPSFHGGGGPSGDAAGHASHVMELTLMVVSSVIALAGIGIATVLYVKRTDVPDRLVDRFGELHRLLVNKGFVDELYDEAVVQPVKSLSEHVLWKMDVKVVDGAVNGMGRIVVQTGIALRHLQNGSMRAYAVSVLFGVVVIIGYYLWS
jgi:NADH-quinone oxidoreductase subunit L